MNNNLICPICGKQGQVLYYDCKDYFILDGNSPDFSIIFCNSCKIGYSRPEMSTDELNKYYPDEYEAYVGRKSFVKILQKLKYKGDINFIQKKMKRKGLAIFEIGAGRAEFLAAAKSEGFIVNGVEPSAAGRKYALDNYNLAIQDGFAETTVFSKQYDLIIMRHVLEHTSNPYLILKRIYQEGLAQGGGIYLKIPSFDSWEARLFKKFWSGLDLPRHRTHFTNNGIYGLLKQIGFKHIQIKGEVVPNDIVRSIRYYSKHSTKGILQLSTKIFVWLPNILQMVLAQVLGLFFSPLGTGRIVIWACKDERSEVNS
jgi:hypothetical protein